MLKQLSIILILSLSIIGFSDLAWSSVEGTWVIEGKQTLVVYIPGSPSRSAGDFVDEFTFRSDGGFGMMNWYGKGTWTQTGKKFAIHLDCPHLGGYFESLFKALEYNVSVDAKEVTFTGAEREDGTIKGEVTFNIDIHFLDLKKKGKMHISAIFLGTNGTGGQTLSPGKDDSKQGTQLLKKVIGETLQATIDAQDKAK